MEYKNKVLKNDIRNESRGRLLGKPLPKYIWVATMSYGGKNVFEFVFDATDLNFSCFLIDILEFIDIPNDFKESKLIIYNTRNELSSLFDNVDGEIWIRTIINYLFLNDAKVDTYNK